MLDAPNADHNPVVSALRGELRARGLDAFILPRFDAYQAEYVAPHDERLAHVTGFTGSAGMAIVTHETVVLFVDGRYVVQAANQCASPVFSHHHLHDEPPETWLASVARDGWTIGYDAMHVPPAWYDRFAGALTESDAHLVAVESNPVDAIWPDQPAPPMGLIEPFPLQFAGKSTADKIADLVAELRKHGAEMMIETQPDNIAWLLNIRGSDVAFNPIPHSSILAENSGQVHWFVADQKLTEAVRDHVPSDVHIHAQDRFLPVLQERAQRGQTVLFDPDFSPSAARSVLKAKGAREMPTKSPITLTKAKKKPRPSWRGCAIAMSVTALPGPSSAPGWPPRSPRALLKTAGSPNMRPKRRFCHSAARSPAFSAKASTQSRPPGVMPPCATIQPIQ